MELGGFIDPHLSSVVSSTGTMASSSQLDDPSQPSASALSATVTPAPIASDAAPSDSSAPAATTTTTTTTTAPTSPPRVAPSLDQELSNVMKGLGSFWGSIRKQSVTALQTAEKQLDQYASTARKDLTPLVSKARANLDQLSETARGELARLSEASSQTGSGVMLGADGTPVIIDEVPTAAGGASPALSSTNKGKAVDRSGQEHEQEAEHSSPPQNPATAAGAFFAKMQTQLASNPNVDHLSKNFQRSLAGVQSNLAHLPVSFQTNLLQLQAQLPHVDAKVAEDYLHKGEHWFTEFSGELGRLAKDAVRVLPPNETELRSDRNKKREERLRKAEQVSVGRKDALLMRLRTDPSAILADPASPPPATTLPSSSPDASFSASDVSSDTREMFEKFLRVIDERGGTVGEGFKAQIAEEEQDSDLKRLFAQLVPSQLSADVFWTRYFFRRTQIEEEDKRRRAVLEGADVTAEEEDFSWDMEDDEDEEPPAPATRKQPSPSSAATTVAGTQPSNLSSSSNTPVLPEAGKRDEGSSEGSRPLTGGTSSLSGGVEANIGPNAPRRQSSSTSSDKASSIGKKSPRVSSDGASSYDIVGITSGAPSEYQSDTEAVDQHLHSQQQQQQQQQQPREGAKLLTPVAQDEDDDSDWE